jgi:hypothetical protein
MSCSNLFASHLLAARRAFLEISKLRPCPIQAFYAEEQQNKRGVLLVLRWLVDAISSMPPLPEGLASGQREKVPISQGIVLRKIRLVSMAKG